MSNIASTDFYALLGVNSGAKNEEILKAYRKAARENHPDRVGDSGLEKMSLINEAKDTLLDPDKRVVYDRERASQLFASQAKERKEPEPRERSKTQYRKPEPSPEPSKNNREQTRKVHTPSYSEREPLLQRAKDGNFKTPGRDQYLAVMLSVSATLLAMTLVSQNYAIQALLLGLFALSLLSLIPSVNVPVLVLLTLLISLGLPLVFYLNGLLSESQAKAVSLTGTLMAISIIAKSIWRVKRDQAKKASIWYRVLSKRKTEGQWGDESLFFVVQSATYGTQSRVVLVRVGEMEPSQDRLIWDAKVRPGDWIVLNNVNQVVARATEKERKAYEKVAFKPNRVIFSKSNLGF